MKKGDYPGHEAIALKGVLKASRWLILRRLSQISFIVLFLLGPWFGIWIVKGNLSSSLILEILPLSDPFVISQSILAGHIPEATAITGALIVLVAYTLLGGRSYCSWVCPINIISDAASWLRFRLGIKGGAQFSRNSRFWMLGAVFLLSLTSGSLAWELVNPVSLVYRGIVFGFGLAWGVVVGIFLLDLFIARHAWCGHFCPVGAFYSLLNHVPLIRISAIRRADCDDCMDCFAVCPEHQVIRPALKGESKGISPIIKSSQCTNCARCIDVCAKDVFIFTHQLRKNPPNILGVDNHQEVSP